MTAPLPPPRAGLPAVLVVDDDEDMVELLRALLEREGYVVQAAHSLEEARALLLTGAPAALITDLKLSDGAGTELLEGPRPAGLRAAILLSGSQHLALPPGFDARLDKPFDGAHLLALLQRHLRS